MSDSYTSRQIRSLVTDENTLKISIETAEVPQPGPDEIVVRVEAAPINPSDLALLFGPADMMAANISEVGGEPLVEAPIAPKLAGMVAGRKGESMLVGNEAAGVVVAAGDSDAAQALLGKTVAIAGGDMFQQYRCVHSMMAIPMGEDVTPREAASSFVNPMTALGMVETMREEGFTALVHTAAASNLGQMLNKICIADGVDLVNIVRKPEQAEILREIGAKYVVDSSADDFEDQLTAAITATNAYMAFDATGGGRLTNTILTCMERAASAGLEYNRYGSDTMKKVYVYGRLDLTPLTLTPAYGFSFNVGGFLLTPFLQRIGIERMIGLQQRVAREIKTTFASHYVAEISLSEALSADAMMAYGQRQTGQKYLICPHK
ncbi:MAG: zinc-binding dehydrogenase [Halioglobus sp.]